MGDGVAPDPNEIKNQIDTLTQRMDALATNNQIGDLTKRLDVLTCIM